MSWAIRIHGTLGDLVLDIDLETEARRLVLVGPNASGKTTLLRAVAGAELPLEIDVHLGGDRVAAEPELRRVGYVPQGYKLFEHLNALENVAFGSDEENALRVLARLEITHLAKKRPRELSGGDQQRVALARALASDPLCLLLDEPLAALDVTNRRFVRRMLVDDLDREGLPAIITTHDPADVEALGGTVVALEAGRVVEGGRFLETLLA